MGLAKETKAKGWWHAYGDVIPENFDMYLGLEEAAAQLAWYEPELVPGLLQTRTTRAPSSRRGPALAFSQQDWQAFTRRVKTGA
jgi:hypothetical protein